MTKSKIHSSYDNNYLYNILKQNELKQNLG